MRQLITFAITTVALSQAAPAQEYCQSGRRVPDLGYGFVTCHDCLTVRFKAGNPIQHFTSEPALYQIRADGPAKGLLSEGDTLVAVDGLSIRTDEAALRLAEFRGRPVRLTVRRAGDVRTVTIKPAAVCVGSQPDSVTALLDSLERVRARSRYAVGQLGRVELERILGNHDLADSLERVRAESQYRLGQIKRFEYERAMGRYDLADSLERVDIQRRYRVGLLRTYGYPSDTVQAAGQRVADSLRKLEPIFIVDGVRIRALDRPYVAFAPRPSWGGHFGIGLHCNGCRIEGTPNGGTRWEFSELPVVADVRQGSLAERLGLKRNDVLISIDGHSLLSHDGGARLGSIGPGMKVALVWRRGGIIYSATADTGEIDPKTGELTTR